RQVAESVAPAGRGSGAQTRKSSESKRLGIINECVEMCCALVSTANSIASTIASGNGFVSEKPNRAVLASAVATPASWLKKSDDRYGMTAAAAMVVFASA